MAMSSAKNAVELIDRAHRLGRPLLARERNKYTVGIKRHARVFQRLIAAFYDQNSFDVFMCQQVPWDLARGLTSIVAGHAKLTWPLWWRFHVFLIACRIQRHWKIVKPEHQRTPELANA
jgi:hypothetical protein